MRHETPQKVVVVGGSGFLGSHVADALSISGHVVTVFDRIPSPYLRKDQKMVIGDLLDDRLLCDTIRDADIVYNFAGIADIHEASEKPLKTVKYNILGTTQILEACRKFNVKRFVYASSIYVYSELGAFYRSSKQSAELLIENYKEVYGVDFTILRYGSLYGPRANRFNFIGNAISQALRFGIIERDGDGSEVRSYINVLDAARISQEILADTYKNQYVMVTGNQTCQVKELLAMIQEIFQDEVTIKYHPDKVMAGHYKITPYSFKPRIAIKYIPKHYYDIGQGLLDTIYDTYKQLVQEGHETRFIFEDPGEIGYESVATSPK